MPVIIPYFVVHHLPENRNKTAIITSLECASDALEHKNGTVIKGGK